MVAVAVVGEFVVVAEIVVAFVVEPADVPSYPVVLSLSLASLIVPLCLRLLLSYG